MEAQQTWPILKDNTLLIVDDDRAFLARLARAMETRGFEVEIAPTVEDGLISLRRRPPAFAVVDMRLDDGSGIDVIAALKDVRPEARAVVLTGYGNIATAVTAVKLGAVDYLAKPADADDVYQALVAPGDAKATPPENPMSADRVRWEHIQRVYELCNRNVSETARRLNMHRRTLPRILAKRAPTSLLNAQSFVMPGLVPGIHDFRCHACAGASSNHRCHKFIEDCGYWIHRSSRAMTRIMDGQDEPGHDETRVLDLLP